MPKQEGQKTKLLALLHILERQTDERHRLNVPQLVEMLRAQGIPCERKSVYSDIDTLISTGYDISMQRGRNGGYWVSGRLFDLAELKLLVDAVQASRFIPEKKSLDLIKKLESLASRYDAAHLQREVYVRGRPKTNSKSLLYNVDALHEAIVAGKMVRLRYHKANGSYVWHVISPWKMAWDNGYYYLIAYQDEVAPADIRHYRVDRMSEVRAVDQPRRGKEQFENFDLPAYVRAHFNMYGGPKARVTLRCAPGLEAAMRERFGAREITLIPEQGGGFHFDTDVYVSEQFFGWVCGFGGKVEITAPADVRERMRQLAQTLEQAHAE